MTKIAVPVRPQNYAEGLELFKKVVQSGADMIELWCDRLTLDDAKKLLQQKPLPTIINLKDKSEHGDFTGSAEERIARLHELSSYADITDGIDLLSFHDFEATPTFAQLEAIYENLARNNPTYIKIATMPNSEDDLITLFKFQTAYPKCIVIGMGKIGQMTRVLAPNFNLPFTFASLDADSATAEGQMTVMELKAKWKEHN